MQLDGVQIGVLDIEGAARAYQLLLGVAPTRPASGGARFQLQHGAVELEVAEPGLRSLGFAASATGTGDDFNGIVVRFDPPADAQTSVCNPASAHAIDHVVIHSPNLDRAIALWHDRLGLRLALDRELTARGLRMLFFRSGGITIEFVGAIGTPPDVTDRDRLYGIAYRVRDLRACRARLLQGGVDVSEIRPGNKRGTVVATVRTGTEGVPTLLIEDPSRAVRNDSGAGVSACSPRRGAQLAMSRQSGGQGRPPHHRTISRTQARAPFALAPAAR